VPAKAELHYFDRSLEETGQLPCFADDDWYRSLFSLADESSMVGKITPRYGICCGVNPSWSDVHARIYDREADLRAIIAQREYIGPSQPRLLSIADHKTHFQAAYQRHNQTAQEFFAGMPQRLFLGRLEDPRTFVDLCEFAGVRHNPSIAVPRSNARTSEMAIRLAEHMSRINR
jgi:hypothetical protein